MKDGSTNESFFDFEKEFSTLLNEAFLITEADETPLENPQNDVPANVSEVNDDANDTSEASNVVQLSEILGTAIEEQSEKYIETASRINKMYDNRKRFILYFQLIVGDYETVKSLIYSIMANNNEVKKKLAEIFSATGEIAISKIQELAVMLKAAMETEIAGKYDVFGSFYLASGNGSKGRGARDINFFSPSAKDGCVTIVSSKAKKEEQSGNKVGNRMDYVKELSKDVPSDETFTSIFYQDVNR